MTDKNPIWDAENKKWIGHPEDVRDMTADYTKLHDPKTKMPPLTSHPYSKERWEVERDVIAEINAFKAEHGAFPTLPPTGISPSESRVWYQARSKAVAMDRINEHIGTFPQQHPVRVFEWDSGIALRERIIHRALVAWRKRQRKLKKTNTKQYRWSSEQLVKQHARVNGETVHTRYRSIGDRSLIGGHSFMPDLNTIAHKIETEKK